MRSNNWLIFTALLAVGCHSAPRTAVVPTSQPAGLMPASVNGDVKATVSPPTGWRAEPLKSSDKHKHQIWISPSGNTAYGVIYFFLPWPVGENLALRGFLHQMERTEGRAKLIEEHDDDQLPGIRFVAEGGLYDVRTNLIVHGFKAWAIYAGTVRGKPVDNEELHLAEAAREQTRIQDE